MATGRPLSDSEKEAIRSGWNVLTVEEIAANCNRVPSVIWKAAQRMGLPPRKWISREREIACRAQVDILTDLGWTGRAIAEKLRIHPSQVCEYRKQLGIHPSRDRAKRYAALEALLLAGKTQAEASRELGIDDRTVSKMAEKLGFAKRPTRGRPPVTKTENEMGCSR